MLVAMQRQLALMEAIGGRFLSPAFWFLVVKATAMFQGAAGKELCHFKHNAKEPWRRNTRSSGSTTALQHYSTTALQHYSTTALQHYSTTPAAVVSPCR